MPSLLLLSSGVYLLGENFSKSYKIHDFGHFLGRHLTGVFVRGESVSLFGDSFFSDILTLDFSASRIANVVERLHEIEGAAFEALITAPIDAAFRLRQSFQSGFDELLRSMILGQPQAHNASRQ